jgi:hypothetical protein
MRCLLVLLLMLTLAACDKPEEKKPMTTNPYDLSSLPACHGGRSITRMRDTDCLCRDDTVLYWTRHCAAP